MKNGSGFSEAEVARARRYHRPLRVALLADTALGLGWLAAAAFALPLGSLAATGWPAASAALAAIATGGAALARTPLAAWRHRRDRAWGLTGQGWGGWALDRAKGAAVGAALAAAAVLPLVGLARALPSVWPAPAAAVAAALVVLTTFVAPLVLEPVFNRFRPLADERLAAELRALSRRAGVPVRDVLVADASRRTRRHNAYVSGLGRTRRVVVWDTLLAGAGERELALVVAHELGHRRHGHVAVMTALAAAGAAAFVAILWALPVAVADPRRVPLVLLVSNGLELLGLPFLSALSRRFERTADRFSLDLTGDPETYARAHRELALANLADLAPPRALYLALFTHPTAPERLAAGRAWALAHERT